MKASFRATNAFLSGLKYLGRRNWDVRCFASADLALSWSNSSEDEVFEVDQPLCLSNSAAKFHPFDQYRKGSVKSELELVESILSKRGWSFGSPYLYRVDLEEDKVIKGLNDVFECSSDANLALCLFRWLEEGLGFKHTVRSVCTMAYVLVCGNMNHRAVELMVRLVGESSHDDPRHDFVLKVLKEICVLRSALETLCSMLVKCYVDERLPKVAVSVVYDMGGLGVSPSSAACHLLLRSLLLSGQEEAAWGLLEKMQNWKVVNASGVSLFIGYYCRKGSPRCGWELLIGMRGYGIEPDVVSFTILIHSLCKMSRLKEATLVLFKMIGLGISPDSVSLSCIVDGYCKMAKPEETLRILDSFSVPLNLYVYNSLLSVFCRDGNIVQVYSTFQEMLGLGFVPDCFSYSTMIDGYCKAKELNKALQFLGRMFKVGVEPSVATYTTLINSYCGSGKIESAECLFEEMTRKGILPDIIVYNTLINGYGKNGQLHKAFKILDLMKAAEVSPDTVTYNNLIHGLVLSGFVNAAKDLLDELLRRDFPTDTITLTPIIGGFSNKGQFEEAFLVWSYLTHNMKPDVITCSALLNGYCRARRMAEAVALFKRMIDAGLIPDLILYNTMIHGFCSLGKIEDACKLLDFMVRRGVAPNDSTLQALVHGHEKIKVENPVEIAAIKLQEILMENGMQV